MNEYASSIYLSYYLSITIIYPLSHLAGVAEYTDCSSVEG